MALPLVRLPLSGFRAPRLSAPPPGVSNCGPAQILRYYHAEKWTAGTIAAQLRVHHTAVARVLAQAGLPQSGRPPRPSRIDPYLPFIRQTLETFPTLTASRLHAMARERGYRGSPDHFRHLIACHRPRPPAEAYLRLRTLPGEQAQSLPPPARISANIELGLFDSAVFGEVPADAASVVLDRELAASAAA
jgi:hypothetical protein